MNKKENIIPHIKYKDQIYKQYKNTGGGKNKNPIIGCYWPADAVNEEENNNLLGTEKPQDEKFVKSPDDKKELFTELFAGLFIKELFAEKIIPKTYQDCAICADYGTIQNLQQLENVPNNSPYVLVQKYVLLSGAEGSILYDVLRQSIPSRIINAKGFNPSKRHPWVDWWYGDDEYRALFEHFKTNKSTTPVFTFYYALALSIWIGDYSVHNGNFIFRNIDNEKEVLSRIDWGASLRQVIQLTDFSSENIKQFVEKNNILLPREYTGLGFFKRWTKNYIRYCTAFMPGCREAISWIASQFLQRLGTKAGVEKLKKIIIRIIQKIPPDMFSEDDCEAIANHIGISDLKETLLKRRRAAQSQNNLQHRDDDEEQIVLEEEKEQSNNSLQDDAGIEALANVLYFRLKKLSKEPKRSFYRIVFSLFDHSMAWLIWVICLAATIYLGYHHKDLIFATLLFLLLLVTIAVALSSTLWSLVSFNEKKYHQNPLMPLHDRDVNHVQINTQAGKPIDSEPSRLKRTAFVLTMAFAFFTCAAVFPILGYYRYPSSQWFHQIESQIKIRLHLLWFACSVYFLYLILTPALNKWLPYFPSHSRESTAVKMAFILVLVTTCICLHFLCPQRSMTFFSMPSWTVGLYIAFAAFAGWITYRFFLYPLLSDIDPFGNDRKYAAYIKEKLVTDIEPEQNNNYSLLSPTTSFNH